MDIGSAFPGTYLKATDLKGKDVKLLMGDVTIEDLGDDRKPVLHFQNTERCVVLNKTNSAIISEMYGTETANWIGQTITLYPARVEMKGAIVDAIRVRLVTGKQQVANPIRMAPSPQQQNGAMQPADVPPPHATIPNDAIDFNDEIPF